ncbi:hypothetical protein NE237_013115 [Protea cynaroides]|uniref:RING-type E3 ubiquitin transferase n=1 Tax=Protea cynaroides TaxID=273540 RepID=A0A9Q0GY13_9MAGN|nr:hypothetical protein NE237_013115 [Protea cynaroides]
MGLPNIPSPPHRYPQALQLKLYQAFIFSVPILFSIILFLLFYLFYLKRRASNHPSPTTLSWRLNQTPPSPFRVDLKEESKAKLSIIIFDEDVRSRESQCCVCLGEFEVKEKLHQIPSCNHVFHIDCIHHWLQANTTCPLCRGSVLETRRKSYSSETPIPSELNSQQQMDAEADHQPQLESSEPQEASISRALTLTNITGEGQIEGSTSGRTRLVTEHSDLQDLSIPIDNGTGCLHQNSVVVQISVHTS